MSPEKRRGSRSEAEVNPTQEELRFINSSINPYAKGVIVVGHIKDIPKLLGSEQAQELRDKYMPEEPEQDDI